MLDEKDLEFFASMFDSFGQRIDARFDAQDKKFEARFEKQDKKFEARFEKQDKHFAKQDKLLAEHTKRLDSLDLTVKALDAKIDARTQMLLDEMYRLHNQLEEKMDKIQLDLYDMAQYYRIKQLEDSNASLIGQRVDHLETRVEKLEQASA